MKVILDVKGCTGHGRCYTLAPSVFDSNDEGHSVVLVSEVDGQLLAEAETAASNCPERAITVVAD